MVLLHLATTVPINPPGASPVLSVKDVWNTMIIKCRDPATFVPVIETCTVTEEHENGMVRDVTMKDVPGVPQGTQTEKITYNKPYVVIFQNTSSPMRVLNTISHGPDSKSDTELYMTFSFDFPVPDLTDEDVQMKNEKYLQKMDELSKMARCSTGHSIVVAREMKGQGKLESVGVGGI